MEMNEARQNCQEETDGQIIEKTEQRCVNDSDCCRRCGRVSQKASSHLFCRLLVETDGLPSGQLAIEAGWISAMPATSSIRRKTAEKSSPSWCANSSELT